MKIKLKGLSQEEVESCFPYTPILVGYRGSIAHGMYVPQNNPNSIDDKDVMGVTVAPLNVYFGLQKYEQTEKFIREWDVVNYEIGKFFRLMLKCNPNVHNLLWLEKNHYIYSTDSGKLLIENRDLFSSKQIYKSFTGYAYGQLKRMTHQAFEGYMGEKRKKLVRKFGYDTKNAAHLIRILRMGIEFLNEKKLYVMRHDAQQLLEIKYGEWSLERVKREADKLFTLAEEAYVRTTLPIEPENDKIEELLIDILNSHLGD